MSDDRAERIRNIRNRTSGADDADDTADDIDEDGQSDTPAESDVDTAADSSGDAAEPDREPAATETTDDADAVASSEDEAIAADADETAQDGVDDGDGDANATGGDSDDLTAADEATTESDSAADSEGETVSYDERNLESATTTQEADGAAVASLEGAIAGMSDTVTIDERVGEATVDATAIGQGANTYGEAAAEDEQVFDRESSLIASAHNGEETLQMLEFYLNENRYAIEIDRISAIVEMKEITRFPRGPDAIDGVTDLRGEITGVLDPTAMLDVERNEPSDDHYIVVLERDDDTQKLGIRVTDVSQAVTYRESQIDETGSVMDGGTSHHEFVDGIIKKEVDGETTLVAWLAVDKLIENTNMDHGVGEIGHEQRA
ncbi:chemotaxis protein CheW [Natronolimnobius baerhuensis]|uniref:CheW-like domain-containing protein n=1 Tax=Natronolimnobius baerhuensis TaxID=253108 RepID=A0A202E9U1_9EURY|nr:chemotaxis protein CheW [Natronolimnobius baerhuensis]OVE84984.1 hypothetical protein B2G88_11550 [Natronolimnobius baerhuensis]